MNNIGYREREKFINDIELEIYRNKLYEIKDIIRHNYKVILYIKNTNIKENK